MPVVISTLLLKVKEFDLDDNEGDVDRQAETYNTVLQLLPLLPPSISTMQIHSSDSYDRVDLLLQSLPPTVTELVLDFAFSSRVSNPNQLPPALRKLTLITDTFFSAKPFALPVSLTHLTISEYQYSSLSATFPLPSTLMLVHIDNANHFKPDYAKLPCLQNLSLKFHRIQLSKDYFQNISQISKLQHFKLECMKCKIEDLPSSVTCLSLNGSAIPDVRIIPDNIVHLQLAAMKQHINMAQWLSNKNNLSQLKIVCLDQCTLSPQDLPMSLKKLKVVYSPCANMEFQLQIKQSRPRLKFICVDDSEDNDDICWDNNATFVLQTKPHQQAPLSSQNTLQRGQWKTTYPVPADWDDTDWDDADFEF
jgi:hypothetical protein